MQAKINPMYEAYRVLKITTEKPLISVVVPTYCEEHNIEYCLQSIRRQQRFEKGEIEVIVVDSNSPDNTRAIAKKYADAVVNVKARGVGKARNKGAEKARSEILLFVDADTVLDSSFIAEIYQVFANSNVVCVAGKMRGIERFHVIDNIFQLTHYSIVNSISIITARLGFPFFPTVCCACRKSAFNKVGGFDEDLAIAEDLVFSLQMGKVGKCVVNQNARAFTSLRRVKKSGFMKNYYLYLANYFKVFVLNRKPWIEDFPHTTEI